MELAGLAFSGGGIRSATFNLGVLQGLAKFNKVRTFDYLSTVSGVVISATGWKRGSSARGRKMKSCRRRGSARRN